jgi:hypothetical protein
MASEISSSGTNNANAPVRRQSPPGDRSVIGFLNGDRPSDKDRGVGFG